MNSRRAPTPGESARHDPVAPGRRSRERLLADLRRRVLLALVILVLTTAVPQLEDAGPPPFTGTCADGSGQKVPCPPGR